MTEETKAVAITAEEAATIFVQHVCGQVEYWENEPSATTSKRKLEGLAFSILSTLDGSNLVIPGFAVVPTTAAEDDQQCFNTIWPKEDIAGSLHEIFHSHMETPANERTEYNEVYKRFKEAMDDYESKR